MKIRGCTSLWNLDEQNRRQNQRWSDRSWKRLWFCRWRDTNVQSCVSLTAPLPLSKDTLTISEQDRKRHVSLLLIYFRVIGVRAEWADRRCNETILNSEAHVTFQTLTQISPQSFSSQVIILYVLSIFLSVSCRKPFGFCCVYIRYISVVVFARCKEAGKKLTAVTVFKKL